MPEQTKNMKIQNLKKLEKKPFNTCPYTQEKGFSRRIYQIRNIRLQCALTLKRKQSFAANK